LIFRVNRVKYCESSTYEDLLSNAALGLRKNTLFSVKTLKRPKVVLQIDISDMYGRGIVRGISNYSQQLGQWYLVHNNMEYFDSTGLFDPARPDKWLADGIISDNCHLPEMVKQLDIPAIAWDTFEAVDDMPKIEADGRAIAQMAIKHFMDRNFSQLAYCGFEGMDWVKKRGEFYWQCAKARGYDAACYEMKAPKDGLLWEEELEKLGTWLNSLPQPLGLLTCNDDCAKRVLDACRLASIGVPDDVAILGIDNDDMVCLPIEPPLSSIALDFEKAGFEAAELLDKLMKSQEKPANQCIAISPTYIKVRRSTDTFAVDDTEIKMALQYIREYSHKAISVPDVVEAACLSRRGLEYRFKSVLGRSINNVIRTQRIIKITEMLIETNLPISQIAYELGFSSIEHISRFFGKEKGITPSGFRNKYRKT